MAIDVYKRQPMQFDFKLGAEVSFQRGGQLFKASLPLCRKDVYKRQGVLLQALFRLIDADQLQQFLGACPCIGLILIGVQADGLHEMCIRDRTTTILPT